MNSKWRITVLAAMLLGTSAVLATPVAAAKGVGLLPSGTYQSSFAGADYSGFANNVQIYFNADAFTQVARPDGAPQSTTSETDLFLNLYDYTNQTFTSVCVTLDHPSDFSIDNRLHSAALNTTVTPSTPSQCPWSPPLTTDVAITASWKGIGPLATSSGVSNYACAGYVAESSNQGLTNTAMASFSLTTNGTTTVFPSSLSGLNSDNSHASAQGPIDPGCGPTGFGSGPTPAGHYRSFGLFQNGFWMTPPFNFNSVDLFENGQSSQTGGSPATSSAETDLDLSFFGDTFNGFGCFAIPTSDVVANGLVSASVQTTVTSSTPICTNSFPGFGLSFPLTVSASWTGTGPVASVHNQSNYKCLGYTQSSTVFVQNRGATSSATVTMLDYYGNPITLTLNDGAGSLTQVSQSIQANGVLPQSCLIRF